MGKSEERPPNLELAAVDDEHEGSSEDAAMKHLLQLAGPRPAVPKHVLAEVKRVTHPAWQEKVQRHAWGRRRRGQWTLALAAGVLAALGLIWWQADFRVLIPPPSPVIVATIELLGSDPSTGSDLTVGSVVETGADSRARLRLNAGASLRLDVGSSLRLDSATAMTLQRGAVYLDTDSMASSDVSLKVKTPFGVAQDIGTQFEVRLLEEAMRVLVREGEVAVDVDGTSHAAPAGSSLTLHRDGSVKRAPLATHAEPWQWVLATSPGFDLEGRTLSEFLDWVVRETGLQLSFPDRTLESEAEQIRVHGSIDGLSPDQAPKVVLPSSGLAFRIEDGLMVVERR